MSKVLGGHTLKLEKLLCIYIIKGVMSVYLSVFMLPMSGRTAGPIKTKLGIGTHECFSQGRGQGHLSMRAV